jgi:hypothetical protein
VETDGAVDGRRETAKQRVRNLRDRENEHQIERQLGVGDAAVLMRRVDAKQRTALIVSRHAPLPAWN